MIIYVIFGLVVAVALSWTLIKPRVIRFSVGLIFSIALIGAVALLTLNFTDHYGMKKVTTVRTQRVYSALGSQSAADVLIAKQLGTQSDNYIFAYREQRNGSTTTHFVPNQKKVTTMVKKRATYQVDKVKYAAVTTTTVRWGWKNATMKRWFNVGVQDGELVSQKRMIKVPDKTWIVLSPSQLKTLQKSMKKTAKSPISAAQQAEMRSLSKHQLAVRTVKQLKQELNN